MNMLLLQAPAGGGMDFTFILLMMGIFLVVQFVILGPKQKKKEKESKEYLSNLSNGSKVVTTSGIHGKYLRTEDNLVVIEVDSGVKLRMEPSGISYELTKAANTAPATSK